MQAFFYRQAHEYADFAVELGDQPEPENGSRDLLVRVKAFSFNPVDAKIRRSRSGSSVILGWDASGIVEQIGSEVVGFVSGDEVFYSGDIQRLGSNAELQTVDHRLVARKPERLSFAETAALPLTMLAAYEALFEHGQTYTKDSKVLIIGGAGGVGSAAIQLLKTLTEATVIVTASRPETRQWCLELGADHVIGRELVDELEAIGIGELDAVFSTTHTSQYLSLLPSILRPFGSLSLIDAPETLDIVPFRAKSLSIHWESMFTKSSLNYQVATQGKFLSQLAKWIDEGKIRTTLRTLLPANLENFERAHSQLESGSGVGKMVMEW